ncbi:MAG: hypothetical protein ACO32J_02385 [Phycisphaerales bacterium]
MPHSRALPAPIRLLLAMWPLLLAACGAAEREFPGYTRDQVWKAMVETAEDPRYPDWVVVDNQVWRDDTTGTVQIRRDLRRDLVIVGQKPRREAHEWHFTATVASTEPPLLTFTTSTPCVPAHFWLQGDQFMHEVERRLQGRPLPAAKQVTPTGFLATEPQPRVEPVEGAEDMPVHGPMPSLPIIPDPLAPRPAPAPASAPQPAPPPQDPSGDGGSRG